VSIDREEVRQRKLREAGRESGCQDPAPAAVSSGPPSPAVAAPPLPDARRPPAAGRRRAGRRLSTHDAGTQVTSSG
jgi:hypothetical protein